MIDRNAYDDSVRFYSDMRDDRVTSLNDDWKLDEIDALEDDEELSELYDDEPDWDGQDDDTDEWN